MAHFRDYWPGHFDKADTLAALQVPSSVNKLVFRTSRLPPLYFSCAMEAGRGLAARDYELASRSAAEASDWSNDLASVPKVYHASTYPLRPHPQH